MFLIDEIVNPKIDVVLVRNNKETILDHINFENTSLHDKDEIVLSSARRITAEEKSRPPYKWDIVYEVEDSKE